MSTSVQRLPAHPSLEQLRKQAKELLQSFHAADITATQRVRAIFTRKDDVVLADAQFVIAREYGFDSWPKLVQHVDSLHTAQAQHPHGMSTQAPFYRIDWSTGTIEPKRPWSARDWDALLDVMQELRLTGLNAHGQLTDAVMSRLAQLDHVTRLNFGGTDHLTDAGLQHLAKMPQLEELDLSDHPGGNITDRALEALRHLPALRRFQMCWQSGITDVGVQNLRFCEQIESVDVMGSRTGDGLIAALAGKRHLRHLKAGRRLSDAGIPLLHELPLFKTWHEAPVELGLMTFAGGPTHLTLDGPFTNRGLEAIRGLDGLYGINFFWHVGPAFTSDGLAVLKTLPRLGFLGCDGNKCDDIAMRHIGALPNLRMLMGQGAIASDDGFTALSKSQTIEFIWGRDCPNFASRGFAALANMPALRGVALSCKNVDDAALATLPSFPALTQLLPMDVRDAGFRHIGKCAQLERLWCMYCRDTTDRATEHIAELQLTTYYAGKTLITDRSLEILGRMTSLESLEFWQVAGITNAGIAHLAALPKLRELTIDEAPHVTRAVLEIFPERVRVNLS